MSYQEIANADISASMSEHNVLEPFKTFSLGERKQRCDEESFPYHVAVLNVTGELNVGNIIRTSSLCGAQKVHILGRRKYDKRGTVGAENYIPVRRVDLMEDDLNLDLDAVSDYFSGKHLFPIFVEQTRRSRCLSNDTIRWFHCEATRNYLTPCFVFGNEGRGIPYELMVGQTTLELQQRGVLRSFNVGSTAAIVLYQVMEYFRG